jgi:hypothetical protein
MTAMAGIQLGENLGIRVQIEIKSMENTQVKEMSGVSYLALGTWHC